MDTKKKMLRKAAAFISALTFLSVSNMGTLSAMAAVSVSQGTSLAASGKVEKTEPAAPENDDAAVTTAPAVTTSTSTTTTTSTTSQTTTTTTTTTTSTTTTTATTTVVTSIAISFDSSVHKDEREAIKDHIEDELNSSADNYELELEDKKLIITYNNTDEEALNTYLNSFEWDVPDDEKKRFSRYKFNEASFVFNETVYYRVSGDKDKLSNDVVSLTEKTFENGTKYSYIKKDTVLKRESFKLNKYHYADEEYEVRSAIEIKKDGVYKEGASDAEILFLEKTFSLKFNLAEMNAEIITQDGMSKDSIKYSDIDKYALKVTSKKCDFFKLYDSEEYFSDEYRLEKNEMIIPFSQFFNIGEKKEELNDTETFTYSIIGQHDVVSATVKFPGTSISDQSRMIRLVDSKYYIDPVIPVNNESYYLAKCEYRYADIDSDPIEFSSYEEVISYLENNKEIALDSVKDTNVLRTINDKSPNYFVLEYCKAEKQADSNDTRLAFNRCRGAIDNSSTVKDELTGEEVIVAELESFTLDLGTEYAGCDLYFIDKNNGTLKVHLNDTGKKIINIPENTEYYRFQAINKPDDSFNTSIPMEPFSIFFDTDAPEIGEIDNDGKWKDKKIIKLRIDEKYNNEQLNQNVSDENKINSIAKIKVNDLLFIKPDEGWKTGETYDAVSDLRIDDDYNELSDTHSDKVSDNQQILDSRKNEITSQEKRITQLNKTLDEKNSDLKKYNAQKTNIQAEIESAEAAENPDSNRIENLQAECDVIVNKISDLESEISSIKNALKETEIELRTLKNNYESLEAQFARYAYGPHYENEAFDHRYNVNEPYKVTITPKKDEEDDNKVYFEVLITVSGSEGQFIHQDFSISACDCAGNWNDPQKVENVKVEQSVPYIKSLTFTDDHGEAYNDDVCGNIVKIKAPVSDQYDGFEEFSDIKGVDIYFSPTTEPFSPVHFYFDKKDYEAFLSRGGISCELERHDEEKNYRIDEGYIIIVVTDEAGNKGTYYYSSDGNGKITTNSDEATLIKVDRQDPSELLLDLPKSNKPGWYSTYPEIQIKAADAEGTGNTGIEKIRITIDHGGKLIDECITLSELTDADGNNLNAEKFLAEGKFSIVFENNDDSAPDDIAVPHIRVDGNAVKFDPLSNNDNNTVTLNNEDKIIISVEVSDYGHNSGESSDVEISVDATDPEVNGTFVFDDEQDDATTKITSFGAFANNKVRIKVPVKDLGISSGFDHAQLILKSGSSSITIDTTEFGKENDVEYAVFDNVPKEKIEGAFSGIYELECVVTDNVGRKSESIKLKAAENIDDFSGTAEKLAIENKAPELKCVIRGKNEYLRNAKERWFGSDITLEFNAEDKDSGLSYFKADNQEGNKSGSYRNVKVNDDTLTLYANERDGRYEFSAEAKDNAGNSTKNIMSISDKLSEESETVVVFKDTSAPWIESVSFNNTGVNNSGEYIPSGQLTGPDLFDKYDHFTNYEHDDIITVTANDGANSSGIGSIYLQLVDPFGNDIGQPVASDKRTDENRLTSSFTVPANFKGSMKVWAVDNVGNKSDVKSPNGYISETPDNHAATSSIDISLPESGHTDAAGNPLYNAGFNAEVTVSEPQSGVNIINWNHSSGVKGNVIFDGENNTDTDSNPWKVIEKDRNIVTNTSRDIAISKEGNDNILHVDIIDNAGNPLTAEKKFSIDTTAPELSISGIDQAGSGTVKYYNTGKKLRVDLRERNYADPVINGEAKRFTPVNIADGNDAGIRYYWDEDCSSDGRYSFVIDCTDRAGNKANQINTGTFVVDTVAPVASISAFKPGGGALRTGEGVYIDSDVEVSVSVQELNFDPASMRVTINGTAYDSSGWSGGNVHTLSVPSSYFADGGKYVINVTGKDLAGNNLKPVSTEFTVDKKKPVINIDGVKAANNGDVAPVVKIVEDNIEISDVTISRNNEKLAQTFNESDNIVSYRINDGAYITGKWENGSANGVSRIVFDNFPMTEAFDGNYEINVSVTDKAYNKTFASQEFSVNRFGSVFTIENAEKINGCHLSKAPEIKITERNVDKHDGKNEVVIIVDKGTDTVQLTKDQYTVSEPVALKDGSGYEYVYTIDPGFFDQDLEYSITVQTVDAAGNRNVSTLRGADVSFSIDTHEPEFKCDGLSDRAEFRDTNREFRLNADEQLMHIKVTTSLGEVLLDAPGRLNGDNSYSFILPASNRARDLTIELIDLAGNTTVKTFSNLLVTENVVLYAMHKTWAKAAAAAAAALGLAAAGGFVIARRRKRKLD